MDAAIFYGLSLCLAANLAFCAAALASDLRLAGPRRLTAAAAVFLGLCLCTLAAGSRIQLRGGYDNEHDFGVMAQGFSPAAGRFTAGPGKEIAPAVFKILYELPGGPSLDATLAVNALLLPLCALLAAGALLRTGVPAAGAAAAACLLGFNFLALLNTRVFSLTLANAFFLLSGVYALCAFAFSGKATWRGPAWLAASWLPVLAARFEFLPALAAGAAALALLNAGALRRAAAGAWQSGPAETAASAAFSAAGAAALAWRLRSITDYNGPAASSLFSPPLLASNFAWHLGAGNLSVFSGLPPAAAAAAAVVPAFLLYAGFRRENAASRFWGLWTAAWLIYFSAIYMKLDLYPLQFMRHDLYFFIPFVLAAGAAAGALAGLAGRWRPAGLRLGAALLLLYAAANLRAAVALNGQLRTNDREWQFLYNARRAWPAGCAALTRPGGPRELLLERYFPRLPGAGDCLLYYRSPADAVFGPGACQEHGLPSGPEPAAAGKVFMEEKFRHRFYTIWEPGGKGVIPETRKPLTLTAGFYALDARQSAALLTRAAMRGETEAVLRAGLGLQAAGRPAEAAAVFSAALERGLADPQLYNARGVALALAGDYCAAALDLKAALRLDPESRSAALSLKSVEALASGCGAGRRARQK